MAEQQLVDYIKKARDAGQADDQSRALLLKNGWLPEEISDVLALTSQPQAKPQPAQQPIQQPQQVSQPKMEAQPQPASQPQVASQPKPQPVSVGAAQQFRKPQAVETVIQGNVAQQSSMPRMKGGSHLVLKLLMVLIIIVVLGGVGYFVAGQYISLPWNPFAPNPATVIEKMLNNMNGVKSNNTQVAGEINILNGDVTQGKLALNFIGASDITNASNPKGDGIISLKLTLPGSDSPAASININTVIVDGATYVKLNDFSVTSALPFAAPDLSKISKTTFYKIDQDSVRALSQVNQGFGTVDLSQANSTEITKNIQSILSTEKIFLFDKQLNDEVVSGQDTYHYLVKISASSMKDLLNKIIAQNTAGAFVSTLVDAVGDINVEIWIGKKDYMLYQAKVDKAIDLSKIIPVGTLKAEIKLSATNSNFDMPVVETAPEGALKIETVLLPLLKGSQANLDMNQIKSIADILFGTAKSYVSLCSRGLLNGYLANSGPALVNLHNDIVGQGATKPACFSSVTDYCVSTQLSNGSYLCIDKNGTGATRCISASTACR